MSDVVGFKFSIVENGKTVYLVSRDESGKLKVIERVYGQYDYLYTDYELEFDSTKEFAEYLATKYGCVNVLEQIISNVLFKIEQMINSVIAFCSKQCSKQ